MEMINQLNLIVSQFRISLIMVKKIISLQRAVSYFSLLLVSLSLLFLLLHSLKANLSSYCISLYDFRSNGKKYMFLLCNGILVFIVKSSSLSSSVKENDRDNGSYEKQINRAKHETKAVSDLEEKTVSGHSQFEETEENRRNGFSLIVEAEVEEEQFNGVYEEEDEDEEGQEEEKGGELLSIEELNERCEEFIRRRKEEMKSERMITF
ncbi:hypothetical protein Ancab_010794 [Ancistrocladus abbreviatus]